MEDNVAIIMARGASKRVPRKNIRRFLGLPMVAWPVRHAVASGLFSEVLISTDDPDIAEVAVAEGARFHSLRPAEISDDYTITRDVLRFELNCLRERSGKDPDNCCYLYGTSAMATSDVLRRGLFLLRRKHTEQVIAVTQYRHPVERAFSLGEHGELLRRWPEFALRRTQDLEPLYHDVGLLYWVRIAAFRTADSTNTSMTRVRGLQLSALETADIDTEDDWILAEKIAAPILARVPNAHGSDI